MKFLFSQTNLRKKSTTYDSILFHLSSTKQEIEINRRFFSKSAERRILLCPTSQFLKHFPDTDKSVLPALFELAGLRMHFFREICCFVHTRHGTKAFHTNFDFGVRHPRCVGSITKNFLCFTHIVEHVVVQ